MHRCRRFCVLPLLPDSALWLSDVPNTPSWHRHQHWHSRDTIRSEIHVLINAVASESPIKTSRTNRRRVLITRREFRARHRCTCDVTPTRVGLNVARVDGIFQSRDKYRKEACGRCLRRARYAPRSSAQDAMARTSARRARASVKQSRGGRRLSPPPSPVTHFHHRAYTSLASYCLSVCPSDSQPDYHRVSN